MQLRPDLLRPFLKGDGEVPCSFERRPRLLQLDGSVQGNSATDKRFDLPLYVASGSIQPLGLVERLECFLVLPSSPESSPVAGAPARTAD